MQTKGWRHRVSGVRHIPLGLNMYSERRAWLSGVVAGTVALLVIAVAVVTLVATIFGFDNVDRKTAWMWTAVAAAVLLVSGLGFLVRGTSLARRIGGIFIATLCAVPAAFLWSWLATYPASLFTLEGAWMWPLTVGLTVAALWAVKVAVAPKKKL